MVTVFDLMTGEIETPSRKAAAAPAETPAQPMLEATPRLQEHELPAPRLTESPIPIADCERLLRAMEKG